MKKIIFCILLTITSVFSKDLNIKTLSKMTAPVTQSEDENFLLSLKNIEYLAPLFGDLYWSTKCTNSFNGIFDWSQKDKIVESKIYADLIDTLPEYLDQRSKSAEEAYKLIILKNREVHCGK